MSVYPLKDLNSQFTEWEGERIGILFHCPNCGMAGSIYFAGTKWIEKYGKTGWTVEGDTLENISASPSVMMNGHFHSWITNGKLCVDSQFSCQPAR